MRRVKQVIVMRNDLNMRKGKMCAQASHASMGFLLDKCHLQFPTNDNFYLRIGFSSEIEEEHLSYVKEWIDDAYIKVCVQCSSEIELLEIYEKALQEGLLVSLVTDKGFTEFGGVETRTCLAIGPGPIEKIDSVTGNLKLL